MLKLSGKLLLLAVCVTAAQVYLCPKPRQNDGMPAQMDSYLAADAKVFYFCDSTNAAFDPRDADRRSIVEMTDQMLGGGPKIAAMDHWGYYMEVYLRYYEYLLRHEQATGFQHQALIIPINIRSFSASWSLFPGCQFECTKAQLQFRNNRLLEAFLRPMETFNVLLAKPLSDQEYRDAYFYDGDERVGRVGNYLNDFEKVVHLHYLCRIDEGHRNLVALKRIAALAKQHNQVVLFYFTPTNHVAGNLLAGPRFNERVTANIDVVKQALAEHHPPPVDLTFALSTEHFTVLSWDHMTAAGRRFVASHVAEAISQELKLPLNYEMVLASREEISAGGRAVERIATLPKQ